MEGKTVLLIFCFLVFIWEEAECKHGHHHHHPWEWNDYGYDKCPTNDYCNSYHEKCTSEKGWEVRCKKCSFYQTCMKDSNNVLDECDDVFVCKDIEAFKQGIGSFVFLMLVSVIATILCIVAVFLCCEVNKLNKKLDKANNKASKKNVITSLYPVKENVWISPTEERAGFTSPPPPYDEQRMRLRPNAPNPIDIMMNTEGVQNIPPTETAKVPNQNGRHLKVLMC